MFAKISAPAVIRICSAITCLSFLVLMVSVCYLIRPELLHHPHWGISYFGVQRATRLPYYVGFALMLMSLACIAYLLRTVTGRWRIVYRLFVISTGLAACIALTSFETGSTWTALHLTVCFALLFVILAAIPRLLRESGRDWLAYAASLLAAGGGAAVILSLDWFNVLGIYAWGEIATFLGALLLLGRAALRAVE